METGNLTYGSRVDRVMQSKAVMMWLRNRKSIKSKNEWDRLSENGQSGARS